MRAFNVVDLFYGAEMKDDNTPRIRMNTFGIPDAEYYSAEARRLRAEYVASQLRRLVNRLKQYFQAKAVKVQKTIVPDHSVSA